MLLSTFLEAGIKYASIDLSFNVDKSNTQTISVNHPFTLIDKTEQCAASGNVAAFTAGLKVDVVAAAQATVNYGVVAQGSIVPPVSKLDLKPFGRLTTFAIESQRVRSLC